MDNILVSAPGKLILHGEHAVVYGKKALAACLNLRTYLNLQPNESGTVSVNLPDINRSLSWECNNLEKAFAFPFCAPNDPQPASDDSIQGLAQFAGVASTSADAKDLAVLAFLYLYGSIVADKSCKPSSVHVDLASHLPPGAGLGSSAAYSTCLAASLLLWKKHISKPECSSWTGLELDLINKWAFMAEKIIHGRPSGIDNSISTYGGALIFQNGKITPFENIPEVSVLVLNTHVPRSTKHLVAVGKQKHDKYPCIIGLVLDCVDAITSQCVEVLTSVTGKPDQQQVEQLEDLILMNQQQLCVMGVSHPALDTLCAVCARHGLAAKLTGAGGGGCAFALLTKDKQCVVSAITEEVKKLGYSSWQTTVGGPGVRQHYASQTDVALDPPEVLLSVLNIHKS